AFAASTIRCAVLATALGIAGCGWAAKVEAISRLDGSRAAYRACIDQNKNSPSHCETERKTYQADLADAGRPRGFFTWWPWF
ncbi:MAG TPA: hypothetical protein VEU06_08720, partial [Micropepsaceae bacterium]|nr:hypothetical protein [Micropepsaceae bacterium]